jgi:dUTPase
MTKTNIFIQKDFKPCEKVWKRDIGFNVIAITDPEIVGEKVGSLYKSIQYIEYKTGIKIDPCYNKTVEKDRGQVYTTIWPRSSISKYNLLLANSIGLIDPDFRDAITVRFKYVVQPEDMRLVNSLGYSTEQYKDILIEPNLNKIYKIGDQIAQLVFMTETDVEFNFVDSIAETGRGAFGSTGV